MPQAVSFAGFLDLLTLLAMLVTHRSGDDSASSSYEGSPPPPPSSAAATPPAQVVKLFFFRVYTSDGVQQLVVQNVPVRAFFGAVDRSVRALMQRRAAQKREDEEDRCEGDLRFMEDCLE